MTAGLIAIPARRGVAARVARGRVALPKLIPVDAMAPTVVHFSVA